MTDIDDQKRQLIALAFAYLTNGDEADIEAYKVLAGEMGLSETNTNELVKKLRQRRLENTL